MASVIHCPSCKSNAVKRDGATLLRTCTACGHEWDRREEECRRHKPVSVRPEQPHVLEEVLYGCPRHTVTPFQTCVKWQRGQGGRFECAAPGKCPWPEGPGAEGEELPAENLYDDLPPYDIEARCAKCGSHGAAAVKYVAEVEPPSVTMATWPVVDGGFPEHLRRTCDICGYSWVEACVEQKEPGSGKPVDLDEVVEGVRRTR